MNRDDCASCQARARVRPESLRAQIAFVRENFRRDGAEGDTAHAIADAAEQLAAEIEQTRAKHRAALERMRAQVDAALALIDAEVDHGAAEGEQSRLQPKGEGGSPMTPLATAIGTVASSLPTSAEDERIVDAAVARREVKVKPITRNESTPESREFWASAERSAAEVAEWPAWKRAGINVGQVREEPREVPKPCAFCGQPMPDGHVWDGEDMVCRDVSSGAKGNEDG